MEKYETGFSGMKVIRLRMKPDRVHNCSCVDSNEVTAIDDIDALVLHMELHSATCIVWRPTERCGTNWGGFIAFIYKYNDVDIVLRPSCSADYPKSATKSGLMERILGWNMQRSPSRKEDWRNCKWKNEFGKKRKIGSGLKMQEGYWKGNGRNRARRVWSEWCT